jgi:hypothetical protein
MDMIIVVDLFDLVQPIHHLVELLFLKFPFLLDRGVQHHLPVKPFALAKA